MQFTNRLEVLRTNHGGKFQVTASFALSVTVRPMHVCLCCLLYSSLLRLGLAGLRAVASMSLFKAALFFNCSLRK